MRTDLSTTMSRFSPDAQTSQECTSQMNLPGMGEADVEVLHMNAHLQQRVIEMASALDAKEEDLRACQSRIWEAESAADVQRNWRLQAEEALALLTQEMAVTVSRLQAAQSERDELADVRRSLETDLRQLRVELAIERSDALASRVSAFESGLGVAMFRQVLSTVAIEADERTGSEDTPFHSLTKAGVTKAARIGADRFLQEQCVPLADEDVEYAFRTYCRHAFSACGIAPSRLFPSASGALPTLARTITGAVS